MRKTTTTDAPAEHLSATRAAPSHTPGILCGTSARHPSHGCVVVANQPQLGSNRQDLYGLTVEAEGQAAQDAKRDEGEAVGEKALRYLPYDLDRATSRNGRDIVALALG